MSEHRDAKTREAKIQRAIEEWAAIAGGPGSKRENEPTLAHYIEAVIAEHEKPLREAAMNVVTVYDDHIALENRGPWRDLLASWATCDDWNGERRGPGGSPWHGSGYCIHDRSAE